LRLPQPFTVKLDDGGAPRIVIHRYACSAAR